MPFDMKRKIQWIRIFLTIFYVFMLSEGVGSLGEGILEMFVLPGEPYPMISIVGGALVIAWASLAIYAIRHDKRVMLLISSIVLIAFCISVPAFAVCGIMVSYNYDKHTDIDTDINKAVKKMLFEFMDHLLFNLGAIFATFILARHLKTRNASAPNQAV